MNKGAAPPPRGASDAISELTTNRLSVYLRCLNALDADGVRTVSSRALAEQFHLNAAQIRKDLAYFGEFGVRGVGYYVKELRRHLRQILGVDKAVRVAIMGAGNLGLALADYPGFRDEGFEIAALFDTTQDKIGQRRAAAWPSTTFGSFARSCAGADYDCRHRRAGRGRAGRRQCRRRGRDQGRAELLARRAAGAAGRQTEERGPDGLARVAVVLPRAGRRCMRKTLSHVGPRGRVRMVDVSDKAVTAREAVARGRITMSRDALRQIRAGAIKKGDPLQTARLAGIMAAKQTSALIPLCHPLDLSHIDVTLTPVRDGYALEARVRTTGRTGVEMEALTAVAVAALTIYDMVKAVDKAMVIGDIRLVEKRGGRSGEYRA